MFVSGTQVQMADGTRKAIETVAVGDSVKALSGSGSGQVAGTTSGPYTGTLVTVNLNDGTSVTASSDQPFRNSSGGTTLAGALKASDILAGNLVVTSTSVQSVVSQTLHDLKISFLNWTPDFFYVPTACVQGD